jgi:hypothetical protein
MAVAARVGFVCLLRDWITCEVGIGLVGVLCVGSKLKLMKRLITE